VGNEQGLHIDLAFFTPSSAGSWDSIIMPRTAHAHNHSCKSRWQFKSFVCFVAKRRRRK
jgi:hypothetical protein